MKSGYWHAAVSAHSMRREHREHLGMDETVLRFTVGREHVCVAQEEGNRMKLISGVIVLLACCMAYAQGEPAEVRGAPVHQSRAEIVWTRVLCKQPGRYIGWPTVCLRKNGELLAVFSGDRDAHICPFGKVQMIRSADQGETWTEAQTVCNTQLDDRDAGILELPDGNLVLTWFTSLAYEAQIRDRNTLKLGSPQFYWWLHNEKLPAEVKEAWLGFFTVRSSDGGTTWEKPVRTLGSTPHGPILLKDGRLLFVGRYFKEKLCVISVEESRDGGKSWQPISEIPPLPSEQKPHMFHEPHVVETDDGRLVAQIRYHGADNCIRQSESTDGGKTWSVMAKTPLAGLPPHLLGLRSGKLVSVYGRRFDAFGEYACVSDDRGRTWDVANEVKLAGHFNADLGYPASVELPSGDILTVYYQADQKGEQTCLMATKWKLN